MRQIGYSLMDPTGNYTVLITSDVPVNEQARTASVIMNKEPLCEQVGFLSRKGDGDISLRMAGGEFCGNATMSAAIRFALDNALTCGVVRIKVSGAEEILSVKVEKTDERSFACSVVMPKEESVDQIAIGERACPVVRFAGISHIIIENAFERSEAEKLAPELCATLGADALGLMFYSPDEMKLTPLVYVAGIGSLFWENSCASGSAAVGIFEAKRQNRKVTVRLRQPGGVLTVSASPDDAPVLSGCVRLISEAQCEILEN